MGEYGIIMNDTDEILYIEPLKDYKSRLYSEYAHRSFISILLLTIGFELFIYYTLYPKPTEDPFCALWVTIPLSILVMSLEYFFVLKRLNRFVIYNDKITSWGGKNFYLFENIYAFKISKNILGTVSLRLYLANGNFVNFSGAPPEKDIYKLYEIFKVKNVEMKL